MGDTNDPATRPVEAVAPGDVDLTLLDDLVDRFAVNLKAKLRRSEAKHGWRNGWLNPGWRDDCHYELVRHLGKGDPVDVAAYAAFFWHHGWSTAQDAPASGLGPTGTGTPPVPRLPVGEAMLRAGMAELLATSPSEGADDAGGRALVRRIYRAMRASEIAAMPSRSEGDVDETETAAVARGLCARGCDPAGTGDGRHPCATCDAGADPAFRADARAVIRALDAARGRSGPGARATKAVDGGPAEVELGTASGLSQA